MSERPTPETDAETMRDEYNHADSDFGPFAPSDTVPADLARRLERERDEAREKLSRVLKLLDDYDQAIKNPSSPFWDAFKKWFTYEAAK